LVRVARCGFECNRGRRSTLAVLLREMIDAEAFLFFGVKSPDTALGFDGRLPIKFLPHRIVGT